MLNVGIIGLGYIGEVHLKVLRNMPGVRIAGVFDANSVQTERIASLYGVPAALSVDALIDDTSIDVYHNCTPNHMHYDLNQRILARGAHLLSEKPLALTARQAGELAAAAAKQDVLTAINFCYRYYPVVQEARARIAAGLIGDKRIVRGNFLQDWLLYDTDYNWRLDQTYTGISNTMADIGSHWCDLAQFLTGSSIAAINADARTLVPQRKAGKASSTFTNAESGEYEIKNIDVDDYISALIRFEDGTAGCFTASSLCAGRKVALEIEVYGSQASVRWSHEQPSLLQSGYRDKANETLIESPVLQLPASARYALLPSGHPMGYHDAVFNLFTHFYNGVRAKQAGKPFEQEWPTFENGFQLATVVEAAIKSSQASGWVEIAKAEGT